MYSSPVSAEYKVSKADKKNKVAHHTMQQSGTRDKQLGQHQGLAMECQSLEVRIDPSSVPDPTSRNDQIPN